MIFRLDERRQFFYEEIGETLEHVAQRGDGCRIPGNVGQIEWDSKQLNLVEDVPVCCKGLELDGFYRSLPIKLILQICESICA